MMFQAIRAFAEPILLDPDLLPKDRAIINKLLADGKLTDEAVHSLRDYAPEAYDEAAEANGWPRPVRDED